MVPIQFFLQHMLASITDNTALGATLRKRVLLPTCISDLTLSQAMTSTSSYLYPQPNRHQKPPCLYHPKIDDAVLRR